jgi:hypothetical protein
MTIYLRDSAGESYTCCNWAEATLSNCNRGDVSLGHGTGWANRLQPRGSQCDGVAIAYRQTQIQQSLESSIRATDSTTAPRASSWFWTLATLGTTTCYVALFAMVGRFPTIDEVFFKAPGREWAAGGRFAAPELTGIDFLQGIKPAIEEVWFVHPPGYPFLFGVFTLLIGFGPTACVVFDALIHGALALMTWLLARRLGEGLPDWLCFLIAVAVLPLGVGTHGRPDELAMCLGIAGGCPPFCDTQPSG